MKKHVKVVLVKNIEKLGLSGEEKNLSKGYVKNYLLPRKMVVLATDLRAKEIVKKVKEERKQLEKEINRLKELARGLASQTVEITAKAGEKGQLFGSVNSDEVAKKLKIDQSKLRMSPLKTLGEHKVEIDLGYGVMAKTKINVLAKLSKKASK